MNETSSAENPLFLAYSRVSSDVTSLHTNNIRSDKGHQSASCQVQDSHSYTYVISQKPDAHMTIREDTNTGVPYFTNRLTSYV